MALRAQKKRQGGGSTGTGSYDPRRPNVATGVGSTKPGFDSSGKPKASINTPAAPKPVVTTPAASYAKVKAPPAPSAAIRTAGSEGLRSSAQSNWGIAQGQNRDAIFRAIMNLGDPTKFAEYANRPEFQGYSFTQDPNSVFAQLQRQEQQGLQDIDVGANAGNTFFSGMRLRDRSNLTDETGRQRLGATTSFGDDLKAFAASLGMSESEFRRNMSDADQMDIDAALERDRVAREAYDNEVAAAQAAGPQKGIGGQVPLGPISQPTTPQYQFAAQQFAQRQAQQRAIEAAKRAAKKKGR